MDWKSNLRRSQSQRSIPSSCNMPTWTQAALQGKTTSVSQLVARYQTTVSASKQEKQKQVFKEEVKETQLESLMWRNDDREQSRAKTSLTRSKSMGSLQNSAVSIEALKTLFESKAATGNKVKSSFTAAGFTAPHKAADIMPVMNGAVEEVVNQTWMEGRKTIGGTDFENIAASQADEKRRSVADFRNSSFIQSKEKLCVSVKAMSALYLSKVAPQESTQSLLKPAQDHSSESGKRVKLTKMAEDSQQKRDELFPAASARHQPGTEDISGAHFQQSMPSQLSKEKLFQKRQKCELRRLLKHTDPELKMLDEVVDEELAEVLSSETRVTTGETGYEGEVLSRCLIFENCALGDRAGQVSLYTPKMHRAEGTVERGDVSKTSAVFEEHEERPDNESVKGIVEDDKTLGSSPDPNIECEEEMIRIDVQATRRIFESQSVNRLNPNNKLQGKVSISGDEKGAVQKRKKEFEICSKENLRSNACTKPLNLKDQPHKQGPCGQSSDHQSSSREEVSTGETVFENEPTSLSDPETFGEIIKTSAALSQNNPFIPTNIEHSFIHTSKSQRSEENNGAAQDYLIDNVKNRTHLFESMPFDKIRHQNKDEIETMVENIKETLNRLYHINAIHSDGSIIEVNETMLAKKAKFTLLEGGPKIKYDEVTEGGAQNFLLQLLPRANLKCQITYLKEDHKGSMEASVVRVLVHQHQFTTIQDTEFKTATVVQLVEDILNQDNSLRKGVIIQEDVDKCAEVIVYSLYNYFDEEDVKHYCPPQGAEYDEPEPERGDVCKTDDQEQRRKGVIESTISCLLETSKDQTCQGSTRPEITVKGNVKLFKSCIEKGDLEYLKTLQAEPTEQEQKLEGIDLHHEQAEESSSEWVPVDVKRLKDMFSGDQRPVQPKQNACENIAQSTAISCAFTGKNQSSTECNVGVFSHGQVKDTFREHGDQTQEVPCNSTVVPQGSYLHRETHDDGRVHHAQLVEVVDDNNLQTAIQSLKQDEIETKSLNHSSKNQKFLVQESFKEPVISVTAGDIEHSGTKAEISQELEDPKEDSCTQPRWDEHPSASNISSEHQSNHQSENTETCPKDTNSELVLTTETCSKMGQNATEVVQKEHFQASMVSVDSTETTAAQQENDEVVFEGKLKAALDSLERSNLNVTRGDFRAAMIYRNSPKPHKERSQLEDAVFVQKPTMEEVCHVTESKSNQEPLIQEVSKDEGTGQIAELCETLNKAATGAVSEKRRRPVGSKPAIPPKPECLKVKQREIQSADTNKPEATQINTERPEVTVPQPLPITSTSLKDEYKQDLFKINGGANSGPDSVDHQRNELFEEAIQTSRETEVRHQDQGSIITLESKNTNENITNQQQDINATAEEKSPQDMNETDESHVDFHGACKKFGGKKALTVKNAPVKPKRVKIAQPDNKDNNASIFTHVVAESQQTVSGPSCNKPNTCGQTADSKDKQEKEMKHESKVEMREKKGRTETEDERRQRLSVHMDEIMRGNITAAMDIFDNLRKQEELRSILSRVEEIEQDTSEVDVRSLRGVFENVPDWVVSSNKKKQKKVKLENKEERMPSTKDNAESKSSMAHVFGDLERAREEIMNLKEQTLARLIDIEEAIKKALYSVSTLKSDSDIVGLSCLFKESLGTVQGSPSSGNIRKICITSSKTKSLQIQESPTAQGNTDLSLSLGASIDRTSAKKRASPPSSPAFISIQSAARKADKTEVLPQETTICPTCQHSPKTEEKFQTTKNVTCNSPAQNRKRDPRKGGKQKSSSKTFNPKRELSVLNVQTDHDGNSIMGTKTVTENYEKTDNFGNQFYSSKTSTVVTTHPETTTTTGQAVVSPAYQVTKYPEVQLPINQKP
ncbi:LIM domain-containing protein isoform X2 [Micropterus salmoides]|uniref:LIM domain-containing protein isoform X2 n=1 Tax=Micropterus salmoides TaxID=27706 RepID=UPI0018EB598C|nr:LIM domain-containing protein isoform X2 [Micropterus salmoides]